MNKNKIIFDLECLRDNITDNNFKGILNNAIDCIKEKDEVIDEAIEFVKKYREYEKIGEKDYLKDRDSFGNLDRWQIQDLLEILEKGKNGKQ